MYGYCVLSQEERKIERKPLYLPTDYSQSKTVADKQAITLRVMSYFCVSKINFLEKHQLSVVSLGTFLSLPRNISKSYLGLVDSGSDSRDDLAKRLTL